MEFAILGPLGVIQDGRELQLGGPKQRGLLAILLLHANQVVSRDRLIAGLWGERPPPSAAHTLDNYVSRLRKVLGEGRISTRTPGYVLHVDLGELDLDRFELLLEHGRDALAQGEAREAAQTLRSALALWRGSALADVLYQPFAQGEAGRLEERRLIAFEDRIDADLALGGSAVLVPELEALLAENPFRERLVTQLALALYRSGRQAEALSALQAARHGFAEELGLEPSTQLRELERQILVHDPRLEPPRLSPKRIQRMRLRLLALAVAGAAVAASVALGIVLGTRDTTASGTKTGKSSELLELRSTSDRVHGLAFDGVPAALAAGRNSLWVADPDSAVVSQVSISSGDVVDQVPMSGEPAEIAVGGGYVWVADTVAGTVSRIDPGTGRITQKIPVGGSLAALVFGPHELWVAGAADQSLTRIDPATGTPTHTISLPAKPSALAIGYGSVWVASHDAGTIMQIDPRSNEPVATVSVGQGPAAVTVGAGSVWVANTLDGTVSRLDPGATRIVATIPVGSGPVALAFAAGSLWVASKFSQTVSRIDPSRNATVRAVEVAGSPISVAAVAGHAWIGTRPSGNEHHGGKLTLLGVQPSSIDPAFNEVEYPPTAFNSLAYDTLVAYERAGGPDGLHLVPDLALALPTPTDAGKTYTFRLRPEIHYSDGRLVRASDIRRGLERLFRLNSPGVQLFASIRGSAACVRHPTGCDLSHGILVNDTTRTVILRLAEPDAELLRKLTLGFATPVPPGTPSRDVGSSPFAGTGPYRIVASTPRETRFARNQRFREWSHAAQPGGYPDTIVWRYGLSPAAQTKAVQSGRADFMFEQIPSKARSEIEIHHPAQLRVHTVVGTDFLQIDTRVPPFDDVRVRRALNYAVDRSAVARLYGAGLAKPTCQILPPGLPGYQRDCRYTAEPLRGGPWTGPDLGRAKRLVLASGTSGAVVSILGPADDALHVNVLKYFAALLRRLGYRAHMHIVSHRVWDRALPKKGVVPLKPITWVGGEFGATDFLYTWFACNGAQTLGRFCDPRLDLQMRRASALEVTDPRAAVAAWAAADRRVAEAAAAIPLVTPRSVDFVSSRLRNYQFHPFWGLLVDQVWLR